MEVETCQMAGHKPSIRPSMIYHSLSILMTGLTSECNRDRSVMKMKRKSLLKVTFIW
jgi:hypothetical protein